MRPVRLCEVWRDEEGRVAILRDVTQATSLFHLNDTGSLIWKAIDGKRTITEIVTWLAEEVDCPPERTLLQAEVTQFIESLVEKGLVEIRTD